MIILMLLSSMSFADEPKAEKPGTIKIDFCNANIPGATEEQLAAFEAAKKKLNCKVGK